MNKLICLLVLIFSLPLWAQEVVSSPFNNSEEEIEVTKKFNPRANHWVSSFAFEQGKYEVIPKEYEFEGRKDFRNTQQELWGGRIGVGKEFYLGSGFVARTTLEAYYLGTLFARVLNAGEEAEDIEFAYTKRTGQIFGGDITQSLGWMFDFKTKNPIMEEWSYLTLEPFIEVGAGMGWAYNRINYNYDTSGSLPGTREAYRLRTRDDLVNARIGGGINLTSSQGYFLALKATVNRYDITRRKLDGFIEESGQSPVPINESPKNAKIDPVIIYSLGGGYKF